MDKALLKLYLILALALFFAFKFIPATLVRASRRMMETMTRAELMIYNTSVKRAEAGNDCSRANLIIIMDDGWETQYTRGYKILKQYNLRACIAVIPATVNEYGYISYRRLADLYLEGWDLLNHTYSHYNLLKLPEKEQREQMNKARAWLANRGFHRGGDIVVFPQGMASKELIKLVRDEGYAAARSLDDLWSAHADGWLENIEICNLISSISFDTVKEAVHRAVENQGTLILIVHKIEPVTVDTQMQLEEELFERIIALIAANKGSLNVITLTELLAAQQKLGDIIPSHLH